MPTNFDREMEQGYAGEPADHTPNDVYALPDPGIGYDSTPAPPTDQLAITAYLRAQGFQV